MTRPIAYGIDFGTTNSAISVAYEDHVDVLPLEEQEPRTQLPSIVYLHRDGVEAAGHAAVQAYLVQGSRKTRCSDCPLVDHQLGLSDCRQHRRGGGCHDSRLMSGLKAHLSDPDLEGTHSWAKDFTIPDLVGVVIRQLKRTADRQVERDVRRAVLGHPVNFPGTEGMHYRDRQSLALSRLQQAAELAGFEEISTFPEPAAALLDEELEAGTVLALDFGGGTFDAALVEFRPDGGTVVALQGANIGGELFNAELFQGKVASHWELERDIESPHGRVRIPAYIRSQLKTMAGAKFLMSDNNFWSVLRQLRGTSAEVLEEIFVGGHVFSFYRAIEDAKIRLSVEASTRIELHRPDVDIDIPVTRAEFEAWIAPHLDVIQTVITQTVEQAGMSASAVDLVTRTGGSSSIPSFIDMLSDMFGSGRVQERHSFDSVAHGLGSQARLVWGSDGG